MVSRAFLKTMFSFASLSPKFTFTVLAPPLANSFFSNQYSPGCLPCPHTLVIAAPSEFSCPIYFSLSLGFCFLIFPQNKSSNTTSTSRIDSPIFSDHMVSIYNIDRSNYSTWALKIKLWLSELGYKSHLPTSVQFLPT